MECYPLVDSLVVEVGSTMRGSSDGILVLDTEVVVVSESSVSSSDSI